MTAEEEKVEPATIATVKTAQWGVNLVTLISAAGGVALTFGALLGGGWYLTDKSYAAGKDGAHLVCDPLIPRVTFLEAQLPFVVSEVREIHEEQRAVAIKGAFAPELSRPLAPLPVSPDGGP